MQGVKKGRMGKNYLIQRPLKEVGVKIQNIAMGLTASPCPSRLGCLWEARHSCSGSSGCSQQEGWKSAPGTMWSSCLQPRCHCAGHSMDGKQMGRSFFFFFLQRPPSLNAWRHKREEIPWLSCNPVHMIWPHKCTP